MLTILCPDSHLTPRCQTVLDGISSRQATQTMTTLSAPLQDQRLLFVVSLNESGVNHAFYDLLAYLRTHPDCLRGCVGGVIVDGVGDLYTKSAGRDLVLSASMAGCTFPGRPLVEATGDLRNFTVQAKNAACSLEEAYQLAASDLAERVLTFMAPRRQKPKPKRRKRAKPPPSTLPAPTPQPHRRDRSTQTERSAARTCRCR